MPFPPVRERIYVLKAAGKIQCAGLSERRKTMKYDVVALGELLIDFAPVSRFETGYPVLAAQPGVKIMTFCPGRPVCAFREL